MKHIYIFLFLSLFFTVQVYAQDGMSIGTNATPLEMLEVNGAITIGSDFVGTNAAPSGGAGTIRWNSTDGQFEGWDGTMWVLLSSAGTDDQNLTGATLTGTSLQIDIENGSSTTADLSALDQSAAVATIASDLADHEAADNDLSATNEIQDLTISGNILSLSGSTPPSVDLSFLNNAGTDDQNLTGATLTGTSLQIDIENGSSTTADLSALIQTAAQVAVTPSGNLTSTDVQAALQELQTDIDGIAPTIAEVLSNGNIANDGQHLRIDKVRAIDGDGLLLTDDADNGIFIEDGGNVGVGTTNPEQLLHVSGTGNNIGPEPNENLLLRIEQTGASAGAGIQIKGNRGLANPTAFIDFSNFDAQEYSVARVAGMNEDDGFKGAISFYTNTGTNATDVTEKMRITSTGVVRVSNLSGSGNRLIETDNAGNLSISSINPANVGTVSSVGLSMPSIFTVSGSPVTTSGTLTATLANQAANTVFAGPTSGSSAPSFRALVENDIPNLNASKITSGILPIARGGTNSGTALANNRIMVSSGGRIVEAASLAANTALFTDANGLPTTTAPTTGTQGYWTRTGTNLYNTNLGDRVGIATNTPATPLHVFTNTDTYGLTIGHAGGSNRNLKIAGTAGGVGGYALLQTFSGSTADGDLVLQRDAGSVGIGLSNPSGALEIEGDFFNQELIGKNQTNTQTIGANASATEVDLGSGNYIRVVKADGSGANNSSILIVGSVTASGNNITFADGVGSGSGNVAFLMNGTAIFTVTLQRRINNGSWTSLMSQSAICGLGVGDFYQQSQGIANMQGKHGDEYRFPNSISISYFDDPGNGNVDYRLVFTPGGARKSGGSYLISDRNLTAVQIKR